MFALVPIEKLKPESMQAYNSNVGRMMKENLMLADYFFVREKSNEGNDDSGWSISELNQYMHRESDDWRMTIIRFKLWTSFFLLFNL